MAIRGRDRRERRRSERRVRSIGLKVWLALGGIVVALAAVLVLLVATSGGEGEGGRYPNIGDHWHASYTVSICGEAEPPFPVSEGGVHTHGGGLIHLHPTHPGEAGRNANLARFIASTGSRLTDDSIRLPSGTEYTNGDPCPDGEPGQLFLRVNGTAMTGAAAYVPRDGDDVEVGFVAQ